MTSPSKKVDQEKETTLFGELLAIQKQTAFTTNQMITDIENIHKLKLQFAALEKQAKISLNQSTLNATQTIKQFEDKIKNYLTTQKAQYVRFSNQINQMIGVSKQINGQLTILGNRFDEFQKNVGL